MDRTDNVQTVGGLVNREVLSELRARFDARGLLSLIDRLDQMIVSLGETGAVRREIVHLHVLSCAVLEGRYVTQPVTGEPVWALAARLNTAMNEWGDLLAQGSALFDELARLVPVADSD